MRKILYVILLMLAGCKGIDSSVNLTYKHRDMDFSVSLKPR
jgi:hypothetical protein